MMPRGEGQSNEQSKSSHLRVGCPNYIKRNTLFVTCLFPVPTLISYFLLIYLLEFQNKGMGEISNFDKNRLGIY